ncbi:MAG: peptidoglycan-binding protein [Xanthobacteraceae bacterium]
MPGISASVGLGGRNLAGDTFTIQQLLNRARQNDGLPPIAVDGLVGPETIGAIRAFQQSRVGFSDGRVDPNGPTLAALNRVDGDGGGSDRVRCDADDLGGSPAQASRFSLVSFGLAPISSTTSLAVTSTAATPKGEALNNQAEALKWLNAASTALQAVFNLMQTGLTANFQQLQTMLEFQALNTHFHLDQSNNPLKFLTDLSKNYGFMKIAVTGGQKNFENDFVSNDFANSDPGGFARRNDPSNPGRMFFCMKYLGTGPLTKVVTIIHEAAHYIDKSIDHFASAVPFPNGRALTGTNGQAHTHNYAQLTPDEAMQNAASYACFAIHCAKRADTRPTITQ